MLAQVRGALVCVRRPYLRPPTGRFTDTPRCGCLQPLRATGPGSGRNPRIRTGTFSVHPSLTSYWLNGFDSIITCFIRPLSISARGLSFEDPPLRAAGGSATERNKHG